MTRARASVLALAAALTLIGPGSARAAGGRHGAPHGAFGARGVARPTPRFSPVPRFGPHRFPFRPFPRFPHHRFGPFIGFGFAVPFYAPYYAYSPYCDPASVYYYPPWCYDYGY